MNLLRAADNPPLDAWEVTERGPAPPPLAVETHGPAAEARQPDPVREAVRWRCGLRWAGVPRGERCGLARGPSIEKLPCWWGSTVEDAPASLVNPQAEACGQATAQ
ncbi:hypothetical protein NDU88_004362 [Pleurodeles waltl]|uniref:Uncharacterized protein n=1 Tax=Pleurodeles waltl TaxID=8319 RepID=A0AAV7NSA3_PLEWA|nr:hypothetical protein NDU88_004362 [Pleurodeles waltl]